MMEVLEIFQFEIYLGTFTCLWLNLTTMYKNIKPVSYRFTFIMIASFFAQNICRLGLYFFVATTC
jgi:hypothetical protein